MSDCTFVSFMWMCIFRPQPPASRPFSILPLCLLLCKKAGPGKQAWSKSWEPECAPRVIMNMRGWEGECVSLCMSSQECATTAVTVRVFCCKVSEVPPPPPFLSLSTAGAAVSDKRVSAAAADQASLPGLEIQSNTHILAQIGIHLHTCMDEHRSFTRIQIQMRTHHATSAVKKKKKKKKEKKVHWWTFELWCVDSHPTYSPTLLNTSLSNCEHIIVYI